MTVDEPGSDRVLEQWRPDPRGVRPIVDLRSTLVQLAPVFVLLLVAFVLRAPARMLLLLILFPLIWIVVVAFAGRRQTLRALSTQVLFELTTECVRVRMAGSLRELSLHDISSIDVIAVPGDPPVGHVVVHQRGMPRMPPAIPTGRRASTSSAGPVVWTSIELVDPHEQLSEGALTLWFVPSPEQVKSRIEAAARGVSPHSRGAHR